MIKYLIIVLFNLMIISLIAQDTGAYVSYTDIWPGQLRYASQNVADKKAALIKRGKAQAIPNGWKLAYDQGNSALSLEESLPVIRACFGYVLADGHHDVLSNLSVGATTIPIRVIADLSYLSNEAFWQEAEKQGWVYLYNLKGERQLPPHDFSALLDDPNRYFAAIMARKYPQPEHMDISLGADYPLWVKIGKDIPFIEFRIADVMWREGLIYDNQMGNNPPVAFVEKVRQALLKAQIPGLRVVPTRQHYTHINLKSHQMQI